MSAGTGFAIIGALFFLPIAAWLASRIFLKGGVSFVKAIGDHALAPWHGIYYAFEDVQVRVYEEDGKLWFVGHDVAQALRWKALPRSFLATRADLLHPVEGTKLHALDIEGLDVLLGSRREIDCGRFLRWARMEVVKPWQKRRE